MSDECQGVAVLDDRNPLAEHLFVVCVAANPEQSKPFISRIDCHRLGVARSRDPEWQYEEQGDRLAITPSLHVFFVSPSTKERQTLFHNGYSWSIPFVRWSTLGIVARPDVVGEHAHPWDHCHELNDAILRPPA